MRASLISPACVLLAALATRNLVVAQALTTRVSVGPGGVQADAHSERPSISRGGGHVAFHSAATNLVTGDTNNLTDAFVHDVQAGATERVSVDASGAQANGFSYFPSLSFDGRFVAFSSGASNLVAGDSNAKWDVFVRDRQLSLVTVVSVSSTGAQGSGDSGNLTSAISDDGRFVAFGSFADNLVAGDTNGRWDVFVRDRQAGTTVRASVDSAGGEADTDCFGATLSGNGRYVAFYSAATNLVAGDNNFSADVFVHDLATAQTIRASVDSSGVESNDASRGPVLSGDGRWVEFASLGTNLVPGDTNGNQDVFVRDLATGSTARVNVSSLGVEADGFSYASSISSDGRYVAFSSSANRLTPGDTNATYDAFVHDRLVGQTVCLSLGASGAQGDAESDAPSISADGRRVAFLSYATNLVVGDTNAMPDVFLRDRGPGPVVYCTAGTTTSGCVPSISASGTPSASIGSGFIVSVSAVEGQKLGLLFYGTDNSGFAPLPWGASSSWLCAKSPIQRTAPQNSGGTAGGCDGVLSLDWNAFIAANPGVLGQPFTAGTHVFAQDWFRDPPSTKTSALSNAIEFVVEP